ncbi:MAG: class I SAM-dependent methyltransferase [Burkholderiales bacterium]
MSKRAAGPPQGARPPGGEGRAAPIGGDNTYDRIARFYDVDMARNMPFDDVGFYAGLCARHGGPVLELGCGNGRILLELLRRRVDVTGVDASERMLSELRRKAVAEDLPAPVARMDVRRLGLAPGFAVILCPYSLVTYMVTDDDVARLLGEARRLLAPGGLLVVDAFVPRPLVARDDFTLDYERPFAGGTLVREKRIRAIDAATNRIERRYRHVGADGVVLQQIDVAETIRPFAPDELRGVLTRSGLAPVAEWWNYGAAPNADDAQFFTIAARAH